MSRVDHRWCVVDDDSVRQAAAEGSQVLHEECQAGLSVGGNAQACVPEQPVLNNCAFRIQNVQQRTGVALRTDTPNIRSVLGGNSGSIAEVMLHPRRGTSSPLLSRHSRLSFCSIPVMQMRLLIPASMTPVRTSQPKRSTSGSRTGQRCTWLPAVKTTISNSAETVARKCERCGLRRKAVCVPSPVTNTSRLPCKAHAASELPICPSTHAAAQCSSSPHMMRTGMHATLYWLRHMPFSRMPSPLVFPCSP